MTLRDIRNAIGLDQAVSFGLLAAAWGVLSGPVSLYLIGRFFTREVQGYYYTFTSLLQVQTFLEVGLSEVIVQFSSHEWSKLSFEGGRICGDPQALSRLSSLSRFMMAWYTVAGLVFLCAVGPYGVWFFRTSHAGAAAWRWPWLALCVLFALRMALASVLTFLEGCGQIHWTYTYRFVESLATTLVAWLIIAVGGQLWTTPVRALLGILVEVAFLLYRYRAFVFLPWAAPSGPSIAWYREIWPFQSKIVLSWIAGYFAFQLFTPVIFRYQGAVAAGQMGMTWQMLSFVMGISGMWLNTKIPTFGLLVAKKEYEELDRLALRTGALSVGLCWAGSAAVFGLVFVLNALGLQWAERMLPPLPTALFCAAVALMQSSVPFSSYLRAHKKEPVVVVSVVYGVLIGASTWWCGRRWGATGVGAAFLGINVLTVPWLVSIWHRCRRRWHDPAATPSEWREIYV